MSTIEAMSAYATHPEVADRVVPSAAPPGPQAASLGQQLAELRTRLGLSPLDLRVFGAVYLAILLLASIAILVSYMAYPDALRWGRRLLNLPLAAASVGLLAAASAALTWAAWAARRARRGMLLAGLGLAGVLAAAFIALQIDDYRIKARRGLVPSQGFKPDPRYVARRYGVRYTPPAPAEAAGIGLAAKTPALRTIDAAHGRKLFTQTCSSCHGVSGEGMPGQGKDLRISDFVRERDDAKMLKFLQEGRQPWDPLNTTKVAMPPRGGNPMYTDDDLRDVVAFVRELQRNAPQAAATANAPGAASATAQPTQAATAMGEAGQAPPAGAPGNDAILATHHTIIPPPGAAKAGLSDAFVTRQARRAWQPPERASALLGAYALVTELNSIQAATIVLAAGALLLLAWRGRFGPAQGAALGLAVAWSWWVTAVAALLLAPVYFV